MSENSNKEEINDIEKDINDIINNENKDNDIFGIQLNDAQINPINLNDNNGTFATGIDYVKKEERSKEEIELEKMEIKASKTFFEEHPPAYNPNELSLEIPVDIKKIKKNALNSIGKVRFMHFIKNEEINKLIEAMIKDSFWFVVCFFQYKNDKLVSSKREGINNSKTNKILRKETNLNINKNKSEISRINTLVNEKEKNDNKDNKDNEENNDNNKFFKKKIILKPINRDVILNAERMENYRIVCEILSRMSRNYFQFFIRVCDFGQTRKNDPALNAFKDFMSHSVFYAIYLAFPKSRHLFRTEFRDRIVIIFTFLFGGLASENTFRELKWGLDLGKGNIIEPTPLHGEAPTMKLPELTELQNLIEDVLGRGKVKLSQKKKKKNELNTDILNTPLYRIYAETNKFETLNLVKPIKMSNRKIIDIYQMNKIHAGYVKFAKDTLKAAAERKAQYKREIEEKEAEFQLKINEVKANEARVKKELLDIKIQRVQEYANYCIFLSK